MKNATSDFSVFGTTLGFLLHPTMGVTASCIVAWVVNLQFYVLPLNCLSCAFLVDGGCSGRLLLWLPCLCSSRGCTLLLFHIPASPLWEEGTLEFYLSVFSLGMLLEHIHGFEFMPTGHAWESRSLNMLCYILLVFTSCVKWLFAREAVRVVQERRKKYFLLVKGKQIEVVRWERWLLRP